MSRLISQFDRPRNSLGRISRIENNIIMALLVSSPSGCHHRKLIKSPIDHSPSYPPPTNFYVFYEFPVSRPSVIIEFRRWNDLRVREIFTSLSECINALYDKFRSMQPIWIICVISFVEINMEIMRVLRRIHSKYRCEGNTFTSIFVAFNFYNESN